MKTFLPAVFSIVCLTLTSGDAHAALHERVDEKGMVGPVASDPASNPLFDAPASDSERTSLHSLSISPYPANDYFYKQSHRRKTMGFYFDEKRGAVSDLMDQPSFLADNEAMRLANWQDGFSASDQGFMLGYRWKRLSIEGASLQAAGRPKENAIQQQGGAMRSNWHSTRLAFSPAENWLIKLSRGAVSNLDNLVPGEQVRRTALAATYSLPFTGGDWQATFAWGRNARKNRESHSGFLVESTLRLAGVHSVFGRVEQVGSDSLMRENEALQRQLFTLNRLTVGYYQDLRVQGPVGLDVGAFISRHLVPSQMAGSYGKDPTAYMMFVRFKLQ